ASRSGTDPGQAAYTISVPYSDRLLIDGSNHRL
ncbi:uncharacterized protein METZ01_LOCUS382985, partial [marine metagenome]